MSNIPTLELKTMMQRCEELQDRLDKYEKDCEKCRGKGGTYDAEEGTEWACDDCYGSGKVPIVRVPDIIAKTPGMCLEIIDTLNEELHGKTGIYDTIKGRLIATLTRDSNDPTMWIMEECK